LEELRRIREEAGLSQAQLARESGVDRATINKIEQGKRSPSIATLESLARTLGVDLADFFPKVQAPLPLEAEAAGAPLAERLLQAPPRAERLLEAARKDARKTAQAVNRAFSSEGTPQTVTGFAEDEVRTELRNLGFPDAYFEDPVWPLVERVVRQEERIIGQERQIIELKRELEAKEDEPAERLGTDTGMRR
jgi:transcriptional regulator with XRE-family HTH domain